MRQEHGGFSVTVDVRWGALTLNRLVIGAPFISPATACAVSGKPPFSVEHRENEMHLLFKKPLGITPGNPMVVQCRT